MLSLHLHPRYQHDHNQLKDISKIVKKYKGGLLIIDYGYFDQKMKNTLQSIYNQNFSIYDVLIEI